MSQKTRRELAAYARSALRTPPRRSPGPWWPLAACRFLRQITLRHRGALEMIANIKFASKLHHLSSCCEIDAPASPYRSNTHLRHALRPASISKPPTVKQFSNSPPKPTPLGTAGPEGSVARDGGPFQKDHLIIRIGPLTTPMGSRSPNPGFWTRS